MFHFGKRLSDEELSFEFTRRVIADGHDAAYGFAQAIKVVTQDKVLFAINDDVDLLISFAILGTSLGVLNGYSQIISAERGNQLSEFCKSAIEKELGLSSNTTEKMHEMLDAYQLAFKKSMVENINPFVEISEMILWQCLSPEAMASLLIPGTSTLNPFVHEVISDVLTLTVTKELAFWKGK